MTGFPRLWAAAGQGNGLDVLVELGWFGQTHHDQAVEGGTVGTVKDCEVSFDVLLGPLVHSGIIVPKDGGDPGSARTRNTLMSEEHRTCVEVSHFRVTLGIKLSPSMVYCCVLYTTCSYCR